ncbi:hypothetical protein BDW74DRAFT_128248 [Aspergillus multicolor]|uniref:uncharacterized protein n=1 Tax=Aspergillus multicolor TaxID=41759 RepID=UPI003CCD54D1
MQSATEPFARRLVNFVGGRALCTATIKPQSGGSNMPRLPVEENAGSGIISFCGLVTRSVILRAPEPPSKQRSTNPGRCQPFQLPCRHIQFDLTYCYLRRSDVGTPTLAEHSPPPESPQCFFLALDAPSIYFIRRFNYVMPINLAGFTPTAKKRSLIWIEC